MTTVIAIVAYNFKGGEVMKVALHEHFLHINRRALLKSAAAATLLGATAKYTPAFAQNNLRAEILKIPGVGSGQPGDAEWQKVGELCLGATKQSVKQGEFKGVELTFLGTNASNVHNVLSRGLLKPWEAYTGAKITWIDLSVPDFNARLQQSIALNAIDFDIIEMGAAFEGDTCSRGLMSEVPDWVKKQVDMDDYVNYLKAPVGTWDGKTYRVSVDGDCHNFNYRTDVFSDVDLAQSWDKEVSEKAGLVHWGLPQTWQQVQAATKFLKGKQVGGMDAFGYLDACKPWGGFGFYYLASRASAYAKHPSDKAWIFDVDTMKPRINNAAWVRAIQDVVDALPFEPADQLGMDPLGTGFTQFLGGTGSMLAWWGDIGSNVKTNDNSVIGDLTGFSILPGSSDVYNSTTGLWETLSSGPNRAPNMAFIGYGLYVMARVDGDSLKHRAAWSAVAHLGGKDLSLWTAAYPSGLQPYRNSQFNVSEWVGAGYDETFVTSYLRSQADSYNHPNAAIEPRLPGIYQYYSIAEDELSKIYSGQVKPQEGADAIASAWEKITDQLGRDKQIALYKASLGVQ